MVARLLMQQLTRRLKEKSVFATRPAFPAGIWLGVLMSGRKEQEKGKERRR